MAETGWFYPQYVAQAYSNLAANVASPQEIDANTNTYATGQYETSAGDDAEFTYKGLFANSGLPAGVEITGFALKLIIGGGHTSGPTGEGAAMPYMRNAGSGNAWPDGANSPPEQTFPYYTTPIVTRTFGADGIMWGLTKENWATLRNTPASPMYGGVFSVYFHQYSYTIGNRIFRLYDVQIKFYYKAPTNAQVKDGGVFKDAIGYVKQNGVWVPTTNYGKVSGVWRT